MRRFLPLWLLAAACAAWGQGTLEVITLRHRTAEQVLPVLQPLLEPGGATQGARSDSGVLSASSASGAEDRRLWLRVEELR